MRPSFFVRKTVWFENGRGIISIGIGKFATGLAKAYGPALIEVICSRTGKRFVDVPTWETTAQYEQLRGRKKLCRNRGGSLSKSGDRRL